MLFSKKITTKRDHFAEMKTAVNDAIDSALKTGIRTSSIVEFLEGLLPGLQYVAHNENERRMRATPKQFVATASGIKEVDVVAEQAKAEEVRNARELREQQKEYRDAVNERAKREEFLRR